MKKQIVISVLSKDRPGIVADVASVIYELDGDLADMSQSVLKGFFSMIIQANFENTVRTDEIKEKLDKLKCSTPLSCIVQETDGSENVVESRSESGDVYIVTAQGLNRTGLVAAMGSFCRDRDINILGYETKLEGSIYSMMMEIVLPENLSPDSVHDQLAQSAGKMGLEIVMQHRRLFETVNEISLF